MDLGIPFRLRMPAQIDQRYLQWRVFRNNLHGISTIDPEPGPQRFMTPNDLIETLLQSLDVQRPFEPDHQAQVVGRPLNQLVEEPQSLLGKRKWSNLSTLSW